MTGTMILNLGVSEPKDIGLPDFLQSHLEIVKLMAVSGYVAA
jgi:hypothetical protein